MQNPFDWLWSIIFPVSCFGCGTRKSALCQQCINRIPFALTPENKNVFAVYDYSNRIVEKVIHDLKYHHRKEAAISLARSSIPHILEYISSMIQTVSPENIYLVPIPQHKSKTRKRGYNQSELLARTILEGFDGAKICRLLQKHRLTTPQAHIRNKNIRLQNLKGSMSISKTIDKNALYIIVDDVTSTVATFIEAERASRIAGAKKILSVALAHGYARKK